ncbi:MAG TPA: gfo/Idh/MocA family oxidoreductase, partial [Anaerolineae bacterium]|nr:gfo/Idh/MocA family oxidoreductase [Anaerolineae bacterium]
QDPTFGTDRLTSGILDFSPGTLAAGTLAAGTSTFTCATQLAPFQRVNIVGTAGRVAIEIPFNAPHDCACRLWHQREGQIDEIELDPANQYTLQGDLFSLAVLEDRPVPTPLDDAVANMAAIEAIVASARQGAWVSLTQNG